MSRDLSAIPVWVTRSNHSAPHSVKALKRAGFAPVLGPLLTVQATSVPNAAPPEGASIAFTSVNGVRAFTALTDRRHWSVFCVGAATADFARGHGFTDVSAAHGSVDDLAVHIKQARPDTLVHYSGVHVAGDLVGALVGAGLKAERRIIYASHAVQVLPPRVQESLDVHSRMAVALYSPKGAHTFLNVMKQSGQVHRYADMIMVSLSANIDACLGETVFKARHIAKTPIEAELIAALERAL